MRKFKHLEKIKKIIFILIIIVLIILCINICYLKFIKKEKIIKIFGTAFLIVETGSMQPTIKAGELLIIKEQNEYKANDVVTFWDEDEFIVTHRIIELKDGLILTKGDGNDLYDSKVPISNVEGKVILHSKILGVFVLHFLKPLVVVQIMVLVISNILGGFRKTKEEVKENENNELENN